MTILYSWHQRPDITFINYRHHHCENNFLAQRGGEKKEDHLFAFLYRTKVQNDVANIFFPPCH